MIFKKFFKRLKFLNYYVLGFLFFCSLGMLLSGCASDRHISSNIKNSSNDLTTGNLDELAENTNNKDTNNKDTKLASSKNNHGGLSNDNVVIKSFKLAYKEGGYSMLAFDCDKLINVDKNLYKLCFRKKEEIKQEYFNKFIRRNNRIGKITFSDCEKIIKDFYKGSKGLELVDDAPVDIPDDRLKKIIKNKVNLEINKCKLYIALRNNSCNKIKDSELRNKCFKLKEFIDIKNTLSQVESFDILKYVNY